MRQSSVAQGVVNGMLFLQRLENGCMEGACVNDFCAFQENAVEMVTCVSDEGGIDGKRRDGFRFLGHNRILGRLLRKT